MKKSATTIGAAYVALGDSGFKAEAVRSLRSLRRSFANVPAILFTDVADHSSLSDFDDIVLVEDNIGGRTLGAQNWETPGWLCRIDIFSRLPFERTLFIDTDTEIVGDVSGLFSILDRFDLAAAHAPYRFRGEIPGVPSSFPEFNCGVVSIRRSAASKAFLAQWRSTYLANPPYWHHDQYSFRQAAWSSEARIAVLPPEFNLRPMRYSGLNAPKIMHGFNRLNSQLTPCTSRKIRFLSDDHGISHHRAGWEYATSALRSLTHVNGIPLDTMIENTFSWHSARYRDWLPMREPWIGIAHNPPQIPDGYFDEARPQSFMRQDKFKESLHCCLGLFALSEYHANWLRTETGKPVEVLYHPVCFNVPQFEPETYFTWKSRPVVHVGWWLRRLESFSRLKVPGHTKVVLGLPDKNARANIARVDWDNDVEFLDYLSVRDYDALLTHAIVFVDLIDSSANNVIVDCIARGTPILVNRHAAVEEYLGVDYPLFYESLEQAAQLLSNDEAVRRASRHMKAERIRHRLSTDFFQTSFLQSGIYGSLPEC